MSLLLVLLPIAVIIVMLIVLKKPADLCGIIGWAVTAIVAILFFKTSFEVVFRSTLSGLIKSFSVSLIVATSLFQMAYMEKSGALKRIIIFVKTIAKENSAVQIMILNIGFGTLMVSVGATPVSILPPILLATGYSTYMAIALPCIGYDSLCTYALLGAPIVAFVDIANSFLTSSGKEAITLADAGGVFFMFLPIVSTLIGISMLWIVGKWEAVKKGLIPCIITGTIIGIVSFFTNKFENLVVLTGVFCGIAVIIVMAIFLKLQGKNLIDRSTLSKEDIEYEKNFPLWKAILPWVILIVAILLLNVPKDIFNYLYRTLTLPINGLSPDGKPIATRALWNAYTWILVSTLIAIPFMKPKKGVLKETCQVWLKRAPRPVFTAAIFFAIGEVMNMSGYSMSEHAFTVSSMVSVLADTSAQIFGNGYSTIISFIGLLGGFITGSEASTVAMFGKYCLQTATNLSLDTKGLIILMAGLAFGGGLASVISPAKLQNAAASIDRRARQNPSF